MVHFEDKGMFPKVHWMSLEGSGRFLARIPRGLVEGELRQQDILETKCQSNHLHR